MRVVKYTSVTNIGLHRKENQDSLEVVERNGALMAVICDGIGGGNGGSTASNMGIDLLYKDFLKQEPFNSIEEIHYWFKTTIKRVNEMIFRASLKNIAYQGMGTTMICVVIWNKQNIAFNIGDSRLYYVKDGILECLSHDETFAYQMYLRDEITLEETTTHPKRNILMNALGIDKNIDFELIQFDSEWDHLLLCSDGLHGYVADSEIESAMKTSDIIERRQKLMSLAIDSGGFDNISLILIEGVDHE